MATKTPEQLKKELRTINIDGLAFFVAEGDLLITEQDFSNYAKQRLSKALPSGIINVTDGPLTANLVGIEVNGRLLRWAPGVVLTYYIQRETFRSDEYSDVRGRTNSAAEEWMNACGIEFRHLANLDNASVDQRARTPTVFHVRKFDSGGLFLAAAFYPHYPPDLRRILIDPYFFDTSISYDMTGVMRHELGHVMGFRHEHIRSEAPPSCPKENLTETIDITKYDPRSVMHYFCGNVGSKTLQITKLDRLGAKILYGHPISEFEFARP